MTPSDAHPPLHGGPDAQGPVPHDFSTNGNACGPCPTALRAIQSADPTRYPDPSHTALRERLARWHGVEVHRIVLAASASEFIGRITAAVSQGGGRRVRVPPHGYGDYLRAANAWHFEPAGEGDSADLVWCCDPGSPLGQPEDGLSCRIDRLGGGATCVLDLAYEPLRLDGALALEDERKDRVWQLWTPNKALGLTGIRAAYVIAPRAAEAMSARLCRLAPSWLLGAHGVALLEAWTTGATQQWLAQSLPILRTWKARQRALCESLGWTCMPSAANFFCAKPDRPYSPQREAALREAGVRLRNAASFGLPGQLRLGVLAPDSQAALQRAWTLRS